MLVCEPVASVNGMFAALAARASSSSPLYQSMPAGPGRGDAERHAVLLAEELDLLVALRDVDQHLRLQLDALECRAIVAQRDLVFGAAIDELEQPLRQALLRHLAQIVNVECFLECAAIGHRCLPAVELDAGPGQPGSTDFMLDHAPVQCVLPDG